MVTSKKRIACWVAVSSLFFVGTAGACPVCDTGTGREVRAELVDENLGVSVLATVAPFAVVLGVVAAVHFGPPRVGRRQ